MDGRPLRKISSWTIGAGVLACTLGMLAIGPSACGQSQPSPPPTQPARPSAAAPAKVKADGQKPPAAAAKAPAARREPSEAFQASIRKTVEQRRRRRARRTAGAAAAGGRGTDDPLPVGAIVPWPMPPALIIRQTPQVHDEVGSLLDGLRRGG
ncbi:MAG: hypothetical protein ACYC61_12915 [Isosphaeraceae bacterium]